MDGRESLEGKLSMGSCVLLIFPHLSKEQAPAGSSLTSCDMTQGASASL